MKNIYKKVLSFILCAAIFSGIIITSNAEIGKQETKNIDVVFVIETSKNIEKKFQVVLNAVKKQVTALDNSGTDYQVAVVGFRDVASRTVDKGDYSFISSDFMANKSTIYNYLDKLTLSENNKTESCLFTALIDGTSNLKFRNNAVRAVVVIGQTSCRDPEPDTGYGVAAVRSKFSFETNYPDISPFKFYTYNLSTDANCAKYYELLSQYSGGRYTNITSSNNTALSNALNNEMTTDFNTIINDLPVIKLRADVITPDEPDFSGVPILIRPLYMAAYRIFKVLFTLLKRI